MTSLSGAFSQAIQDWYKGQSTAIKNVALDVASGLEKEVQLPTVFDNEIINASENQFTDRQKRLHQARDEDAAANPRKDYHITLQEHFFALTSWEGSKVTIVKKNNLIPGEWTKNEKGTNLTSKFFTFESGDNFVALLDEVTDFLYIYSWDGHIWSTYSKQLRTDFNARITTTSGKEAIENALDALIGENGETAVGKQNHRSAIRVKNNLIVAVITDSHGINAEINLIHHDENMNWNSKSEQFNKKALFTKEKMKPIIDQIPGLPDVLGEAFEEHPNYISLLSFFLGRDAKIDLEVGNSFAVLQTYDNIDENLIGETDIPVVGDIISSLTPDMKKINSTFGIVWDENYDNIQLTHLHTAAGQSGIESFIVGDVINKIGKAHSLLVGSNTSNDPDDGVNYAFRYTGNNHFVTQDFESPYYTSGFST